MKRILKKALFLLLAVALWILIGVSSLLVVLNTID